MSRDTEEKVQANIKDTGLVSVFDNKGIEIGRKPKTEIDKQKDIFQALYVRVYIGNKILLTKVKRKEGGIAKTNEGKWGLPVATIIKCEESIEEAFKRACLDDIGVIPKIIKVYERKVVSFESTSARIVFAFNAELELIPSNSSFEYLLINKEEVISCYKEWNMAETVMIFDYK